MSKYSHARVEHICKDCGEVQLASIVKSSFCSGYRVEAHTESVCNLCGGKLLFISMSPSKAVFLAMNKKIDRLLKNE